MKIDLYRCDICYREHRRTDIVRFELVKNQMMDSYFPHLCSKCEAEIRATVDQLTAERQNQGEKK